MLCYVILCYVMLCDVMYCYVMLCIPMMLGCVCSVMLCYAVLRYVMLCYVMLRYGASHCTALNCVALRDTALRCVTLRYVMLSRVSSCPIANLFLNHENFLHRTEALSLDGDMHHVLSVSVVCCEPQSDAAFFFYWRLGLVLSKRHILLHCPGIVRACDKALDSCCRLPACRIGVVRSCAEPVEPPCTQLPADLKRTSDGRMETHVTERNRIRIRKRIYNRTKGDAALFCVMFCYVMSCYVMLCYVMLCYVICYVILCYVMYVMLCYINMLCDVMLCYLRPWFTLISCCYLILKRDSHCKHSGVTETEFR